MTKALFRHDLKKRREDFAKTQESFLNTHHVRALPADLKDWIATARCMALYIPMGAEADPLPLLSLAAENGCDIALPHVAGRAAPMRFLRWRPDDPLHAAPFGLSQPDTHAPELAPDLIITPLLGFDRECHRLGYGAGFYDRAFATLPEARRVGLAWSVQEVDLLPRDSWDVPLHAVWTEREWILNKDLQR